MLESKHLWLIFTAAIFAAAAATPAAEPAALNARGVAYYDEGNYEQAEAAFEAALAIDPENTVIRRNLSNSYQARAAELARRTDFAAAVRLLEKAMAIDTENVSPLLQLGHCYLRLDMIPEAIYRLEQAIRVAPSEVQAHELLGEAYYRDNDLAAARMQWAWVLEQQPHRKDLRERFDKAGRELAVETGFRPVNSLHFQLSSTPEIPGHILQHVMGILERAYAEIGRYFGGVYPPAPIQVIVYNAQSFAEATQIQHNVGALYDGKIRIPIVDSMGLITDDYHLREVLYHEYTHVVVRHIAQGNVAWWMNEGLAETFSRDLEGHRLEIIQKAAANGELFSYEAIETNPLKTLDGQRLTVAYAQSHATMLYLWRRFGQAKLIELLGALATGTKTEQALIDVYQRNYGTLLREVVQFIQNGSQ